MNNTVKLKVAIIVAHPDDEILWVGGTLLSHPNWDLFIVSLCRASDKDRAPKFYKSLELLNAKGILGNLDDGAKQRPLPESEIEKWILQLLPKSHYDLIITHNPLGEYTKHLRHEEISKSIINLWNKGTISTDTLWVFAYEDNKKTYLPQPIKNADISLLLSEAIWVKKYEIITKIYGFDSESWEARTTPKSEAFFQFTTAIKAKDWIKKLLNEINNNEKHESISTI